MEIIRYPDGDQADRALSEGEPLLILISFDGEQVIMSPIDEAVEHRILLSKVGCSDRDIDRYFRLAADGEGADWTFVCPPDYKGITDEQRRISAFYKDGHSVMEQVLRELGMNCDITIPRRYQRNFRFMPEE